MLNKLRDRIVVQVDGQMKTGRDVVIAALLGAEEFGFSTAPLVVVGCIMMRVCHLNTCPVGVATQDPELRKRFAGKPEYVVNFFRFVAEEVREHMAAPGLPHHGRDDRARGPPRLQARRSSTGRPRASTSRRSCTQPAMPPEVARRCVTRAGPRRSSASLDQTTLIPACREAIEHGKPVELSAADPQRQPHGRHHARLRDHQAVGRRRAARRHDHASTSRGSAGQSFGAFVPRGITLHARGRRQRLLGQGALGRPPRRLPAARERPSCPSSNIVIGNVALYGATSGEAFVRGVAGERFAVRNSGVHAVVEGIGDHGCEYMTGRPGGRPRPQRAQLRGRHVGRHRLRARRRRRLRAALQPRHGRSRVRSTQADGHRARARPHPAPRRRHRVDLRARTSSPTGSTCSRGSSR